MAAEYYIKTVATLNLTGPDWTSTSRMITITVTAPKARFISHDIKAHVFIDSRRLIFFFSAYFWIWAIARSMSRTAASIEAGLPGIRLT